MHIGVQFHAPQGFQQFRQGEVYHFLKNDLKKNKVHTVFFEYNDKSNSGPMAHLITVEGDEFELASASGAIQLSKKQSILPPWLREYEDEGFDLAILDNSRSKPIKLHAARTTDRLLQITGALGEIDEILSADNPVLEINRRARRCKPKQNETRFRLWLLTYLCFGRNQWALTPAYNNVGRWDRHRFKGKKYGRPNHAHGPGYGHAMTPELGEKCLLGYYKYAGLGITMRRIYREAMNAVFKCKTRANQAGQEHFYHPRGEAFPSYYQFRYRILKDLGIEKVQRSLYGEVRHRSRLVHSEGSFAESVANLLEKVEADGYYTNDRPKGYIDGSSLPPLCCVTSRDVLSGTILGIGFAFGKEQANAYRMMQFCMAVPKDFFCALFGISLKFEEWPCQGLSSHMIMDRGPGAKRDLIQDRQRRLPIREITPSWAAQSKAMVESSHERETQTEGQPHYRQSELTPVQMARREILRAVKFNHVADMSGRFQPDGGMAYLPPTPIALWNYYSARFRTDAQMISIEDAVRTFLTPVTFDLRKDGVWLGEQRYVSAELKESGVLSKLARSSQTATKINGYMLDMCVRHVWVELDGRLLMLDAKLRHRDDEEKLFISYAECQQWSEARRKVASAFREHQHAAALKYEQRFEDCVGKKWHAGRRTSGKPKRNAAARREEMEARQGAPARRTA